MYKAIFEVLLVILITFVNHELRLDIVHYIFLWEDLVIWHACITVE